MGAVRPVPAPTPRQDGRPAASPGAGLVDPVTQLTWPVLGRWPCFYSAAYMAYRVRFSREKSD